MLSTLYAEAVVETSTHAHSTVADGGVTVHSRAQPLQARPLRSWKAEDSSQKDTVIDLELFCGLHAILSLRASALSHYKQLEAVPVSSILAPRLSLADCHSKTL